MPWFISSRLISSCRPNGDRFRNKIDMARLRHSIFWRWRTRLEPWARRCPPRRITVQDVWKKKTPAGIQLAGAFLPARIKRRPGRQSIRFLCLEGISVSLLYSTSATGAFGSSRSSDSRYLRQPRRNFGQGGTAMSARDRFRQQTPELGMVPAQVMSAAVAMRADAGAQALHLGDQRIAIHIGPGHRPCAASRESGSGAGLPVQRFAFIRCSVRPEVARVRIGPADISRRTRARR